MDRSESFAQHDQDDNSDCALTVAHGTTRGANQDGVTEYKSIPSNNSVSVHTPSFRSWCAMLFFGNDIIWDSADVQT